MPNSTNINFNLDYYLPQKPRDNIFVLAYKNCECREIIVSIDIDNLIIGQSYTISYSSVNDTASFSPSEQTIRAAANAQKFSTIMYIDPIKTHIVKAEITGINIVASQMCVIKCGTLASCEVHEDSNIILSSYNNWEYKIDQLPIFKFVPSSTLYNDTVISVKNLPEISAKISLPKTISPLINASSDILIKGTKIGTLIYLSNFIHQNIIISSNNENYDTSIEQGVLDIK
jgi:hypothetical protein